MSKIEEKNGNAELQSAEEVNDREFEQWVKQQFMAEAEAIAKEIDEIPDSEDWEPTEEKFQMLLQKAKEQGTIQSEPDSAQTKVSEDQPKEKSSRTTEETVISEKLNNEKLNIETNKIQNKATHRHKFANVGEKVIKWAAVAAITVFGIFGVSMTSEANRAYVMEKVDVMLGDDVGTKINNDEMLGRATTEDEARAEIEDAFGIKLPQFYYLPDGMTYQAYSIDQEAGICFLQYSYKSQIISFMAFSNNRNATGIIYSDSSKKIGDYTSTLTSDVKSTLWALQWEYKNVYYEFFGKIEEAEMKKVAEKIMF